MSDAIEDGVKFEEGEEVKFTQYGEEHEGKIVERCDQRPVGDIFYRCYGSKGASRFIHQRKIESLEANQCQE